MELYIDKCEICKREIHIHAPDNSVALMMFRLQFAKHKVKCKVRDIINAPGWAESTAKNLLRKGLL